MSILLAHPDSRFAGAWHNKGADYSKAVASNQVGLIVFCSRVESQEE